MQDMCECGIPWKLLKGPNNFRADALTKIHRASRRLVGSILLECNRVYTFRLGVTSALIHFFTLTLTLDLTFAPVCLKFNIRDKAA